MNKVLDNLPYIVSALEEKGLFAYLIRRTTSLTSKALAPSFDGAVSVSKDESPSPTDEPVQETKAIILQPGRKRRSKVAPVSIGKKTTTLKIKRYINMCSAPSIWEKIPADEEKPVFFLGIRIFSTRDVMEEYITSTEYVEYCRAQPLPPSDLAEGGRGQQSMESLKEMGIIGEDEFADMEDLVTREYSKGVKQHSVSVEDIEETLNRAKQQNAGSVKVRAKSEKSLKKQYGKILASPSKVIDVSNFGKSMDKNYGRVLDRIRDRERIKRCVSVNSLPVISDNIQGFERAMYSLGPFFTHYVAVFRAAQQESISTAVVSSSLSHLQPLQVEQLSYSSTLSLLPPLPLSPCNTEQYRGDLGIEA